MSGNVFTTSTMISFEGKQFTTTGSLTLENISSTSDEFTNSRFLSQPKYRKTDSITFSAITLLTSSYLEISAFAALEGFTGLLTMTSIIIDQVAIAGPTSIFKIGSYSQTVINNLEMKDCDIKGSLLNIVETSQIAMT